MDFSLTKRPATIGGHINTRTQRHGEEPVPAVDIPIEGLMLTGEELDGLIGKGGYKCLFDDTRNPAEPAFPVIPRYYLDAKFKDAKVTLFLEDEDPMILKPATVDRLVLEPMVGGMTRASLTVKGEPKTDVKVLELLNCSVKISIQRGRLEEKAVADPELPLEHLSQAERDEREDAPVPTPRRPGRPPKERSRRDIDG